jgi:Flp pilus assembly pilin Flp
MPAIVMRALSRLDRDERGQGTVEYFLVILAATCLAVVLFRWVQSSGGSGIISGILGKVVSWIAGQF